MYSVSDTLYDSCSVLAVNIRVLEALSLDASSLYETIFNSKLYLTILTFILNVFQVHIH